MWLIFYYIGANYTCTIDFTYSVTSFLVATWILIAFATLHNALETWNGRFLTERPDRLPRSQIHETHVKLPKKTLSSKVVVRSCHLVCRTDNWLITGRWFNLHHPPAYPMLEVTWTSARKWGRCSACGSAHSSARPWLHVAVGMAKCICGPHTVSWRQSAVGAKVGRAKMAGRFMCAVFCMPSVGGRLTLSFGDMLKQEAARNVRSPLFVPFITPAVECNLLFMMFARACVTPWLLI